ncbi:MAG: hypothetical protein JNM72_10765 [Deltaproteobacteria bacterium]|jgi:hypothetical protein|nr:hypothetical protein [Deltaproteobacteria bacterium]
MDQGYTYQSDFAKKYVAQGALRSLGTALRFRFPRASFAEQLEQLAARNVSDDIIIDALDAVLRAKGTRAARAVLEAAARG